MIFPFIPLIDGYMVQEAIPLTNAHDIVGGFSYSCQEFEDATWIVSCKFALQGHEYDEFNEWYDDYITPILPEWFDVILVTIPENKNFVFLKHKAQILPNSLNILRISPYLYIVSLQFEAYPADDEWMLSSKYPDFVWSIDTASVTVSMLDGIYDEIHYTTETYESYPEEIVSISVSMLDGEYSQIGYTTETYENYPEEIVGVSFSMLDGDYSMAEYTTEIYDNALPESVEVSISMLDGTYSVVNYTTRTYTIDNESVAVSVAILDGIYEEAVA